MDFVTPLAIVGALALVLIGWMAGRWWQRQQDPLVEMGRLLDQELQIAKRIAALQMGETAEQHAERARQAKVKADILALDQRNAAP